jgi:hypothetical protein
MHSVVVGAFCSYCGTNVDDDLVRAFSPNPHLQRDPVRVLPIDTMSAVPVVPSIWVTPPHDDGSLTAVSSKHKGHFDDDDFPCTSTRVLKCAHGRPIGAECGYCEEERSAQSEVVACDGCGVEVVVRCDAWTHCACGTQTTVLP